ncbi:MAG: hypothetical protein M5R41_06255 [Bacteroidia bacterium]|nr:hypothetical protein [Bacteroidia bacterium]
MKRLVLFLFALLPIASLNGNAQIVGGVALEYDSAMLFTVEAGTTLQFELVARDTANNVIENWHTIGQNAVLAVRGTDAETDSSTRSWSADPLGFSWLELRLNGTVLTLDSVGQDQGLYYTLPPSAFTLGKATLDFTLTLAGKDITLTVTPTFTMFAQQTPPITIVPGPHENYLVEVTWPKSDKEKVFLLRRYEIVVAPRDRYLNMITTPDIATSFSAAFPSEFETGPGSPSIFVGTVYIRGVTNYFLMSSVRRLDMMGDARQIIMANKAGDASIKGWSDPFEIIDHAPYPFALLKPPDQTRLILLPFHTETFTWTKALPQDPYTDMQISRFSPMTCSDTVKYEVTFVDSQTLTRSMNYPSDSNGLAASLTMTHKQLAGIIEAMSGSPTTLEQEVTWYVTARDYDGYLNSDEGPLFATLSSPPNLDPQNRPGYRLILRIEVTGVDPGPIIPDFTLHQNFPNPFSPSTSILFDLHSPAHCRLLVYNIVGEEVALLQEGLLESGKYQYIFNGDGLPPGVYSYRLEVDGAIHARSMLLLR